MKESFFFILHKILFGPQNHRLQFFFKSWLEQIQAKSRSKFSGYIPSKCTDVMSVVKKGTLKLEHSQPGSYFPHRFALYGDKWDPKDYKWRLGNRNMAFLGVKQIIYCDIRLCMEPNFAVCRKLVSSLTPMICLSFEPCTTEYIENY